MPGCHVMAKPASSRCNLNCRYCPYIEKQQQKVMDDATLQAFIRQQIDAQPGNTVSFIWQRGEPIPGGLDFFRRVATLQTQFANGKRIENAFQADGISLSDAWYRFFREHGWLVSIPIDSPAEMHDAGGVNRSGKPSYHQMTDAIERLVKHGVSFTALCVVNNLNSQQPQRLYHYLRALGTPFLQFIPLVEQDGQGNLTAESVSGEAWGRFLTTVFDCWVREDIGRVCVQLFDSTLEVWRGDSSQMCAFGQSKKTTLHDDCHHCDVLRFCQGDCPKHRVAQGKSALCHGYQHFFSHSAPHMRVMRDLLKQRRSPMELMFFMRNHR